MEKQSKSPAAWTGAASGKGGGQSSGAARADAGSAVQSGAAASAANAPQAKAASDAAALAQMAAQAEAAFAGASESAEAAETISAPSGCGVNCGSLPGPCAPLAFPYVPVQGGSPVRYSRMEALETGTLFPGLNLPFKAAIQARTRLNNTALVELMALDFALQELGLYLNTHPDDQEVLQLYWSYVQLAKEGRERYQEAYGPLMQTDLTPERGYAWIQDPWPWDVGGNR